MKDHASPEDGSSVDQSAKTKLKLPVPRMRPAHEKLAWVPFVPIEEFPALGIESEPTTEVEKLQQRLQLKDEMGRLVCKRIKAAYQQEADRIKTEAQVGEQMLKEHDIPSGAWDVDDEEAAQIVANLEAKSTPGFKYQKTWEDFAPTEGGPKPDNYAARVNEELLSSIIEGDSNMLGFKTTHMRGIKAADEEALRLARLRAKASTL